MESLRNLTTMYLRPAISLHLLLDSICRVELGYRDKIYAIVGSENFMNQGKVLGMLEMILLANLADNHRNLLWQVEPIEGLFDDGKVPGIEELFNLA